MFRNRTDIGVKFASYFNPGDDGLLPDTTIAFLVTTVSDWQLIFYVYTKTLSDRILPRSLELRIGRYRLSLEYGQPRGEVLREHPKRQRAQ
jgi:hypothetical protein